MEGKSLKTDHEAWRVHQKGHYAEALRLEDIPAPKPGPRRSPGALENRDVIGRLVLVP